MDIKSKVADRFLSMEGRIFGAAWYAALYSVMVMFKLQKYTDITESL